MAEKHIEFDLSDERAGRIAQVIGNKTCKKILGLIAEKEMSEGDISKELRLPINTIEYNLKKLINAGLIEKSKEFFWSIKGKKIPTYKLANKKIIISTKKSFKGGVLSGIIGAVVLGGIGLIKNFINYKRTFVEYLEPILASQSLEENACDLASKSLQYGGEVVGCKVIPKINYFSNLWIWALIGIFIGVLGFILYRKLKGGFDQF